MVPELTKRCLEYPQIDIAYDEFYSVYGGGEMAAHNEIFGPDGAYEIWHNTYYDKQTKTEILQSLFEVK